MLFTLSSAQIQKKSICQANFLAQK